MVQKQKFRYRWPTHFTKMAELRNNVDRYPQASKKNKFRYFSLTKIQNFKIGYLPEKRKFSKIFDFSSENEISFFSADTIFEKLENKL